MKNLATLVALAVIGLCIWKYHTDKVNKAAAIAAEAARKEALQSIPKPAKPAPLQAVAISRMLEKWYVALFSDLSRQKPEDLVPPLTIAGERLRDSRAMVEAEKQAVYDLAGTLVTRMVAIAEERTKALETLLQAEANEKSSLDSVHTASASKTFFAQSSLKKWEEYVRQAKPVADQLFAKLRTAERDWNAKAGKNAATDSYDLGSLEPVMVSVDAQVVRGSTLEKGAYNQTRTMYPWRRAYYDRYSGTYTYR